MDWRVDICASRVLTSQASLSKQNRYSKMEYDRARQAWVESQHNASGCSSVRSPGGGPEGSEADDHFSRLVEQEVDKRLFQEKIMRAESEYQERELLRMEKERELAEIKRQHEREIYLLRRKLHETMKLQEQRPKSSSESDKASVSEARPFDTSVSIPSFVMTGNGGESHVDYVINVRTGGDGATWKIRRRFRQFRELHMAMSNRYGHVVSTIPFPARRLFGNKDAKVAQERRLQLQRYLNLLIQSCSELHRCPLYKTPSREALIKFAGFFQQCSSDTDF